MRTFPPLDKAIACFSKLPGIGRRSAERMAMKLVSDQTGLLKDLITSLQGVDEKIGCCSRCGALTSRDEGPCRFCTDATRDGSLLCVVEEPSDVLQIENAGGYRGRYHVLRGKLSPMLGIGADQLRLEPLALRLKSEPIKEVILALNADVESDATASMIRDLLAGTAVKLTRPAMGIPAGSGIAYSDAVTLARAIGSRQPF
ncbi:MAG: recombination mediator RecR [Kiritimatiellae bacterium]|nr:recombination mediator RecR [Kiritimatiellia bacterium]